jgi:hypothetical protein
MITQGTEVKESYERILFSVETFLFKYLAAKRFIGISSYQTQKSQRDFLTQHRTSVMFEQVRVDVTI